MVLLTPAEELGLSGLHLDGRVRKAFYAMPPETIVELSRQMTAEVVPPAPALPARRRAGSDSHHAAADRRHARPVGLSEFRLAHDPQRAQAAARLVPARLRRPRDRAAHPPARRNGCGTPGDRAIARTIPCSGRLDAVAEFTSPMWKDSLRFMEPNLCGVGGLHMGPTCEHLLADIVLPVIQAERSAAADGSRPGPARNLHPGSVRPPASHRPRGPERLLHRAQVRRAGARRAGSAGPILSRSPRAAGDARRPARAVDRRWRSLVRRKRGRHRLPRLRSARPDSARGRRGSGRRADPAVVSREPHDLVDGRRLRPQELLGAAHRSGAGQQILHGRGAADLPPPHPLDPRARPIAARRCPRARRATCWSTFAKSASCWCSSPTAPTAATG